MSASPPIEPSSRCPLRIEAAAVADADRVVAPAVLLLDRDRVVEAVASPAEIGATDGRETVRRPRGVIVPGLVNAHAHLDLTSLGPRPFDAGAGFKAWADMVRRERPSEPEAVAESVRHGVEACLQGGTAIVGDIAGNRGLAAFESLRAHGVRGVSYLEVFGIGRAEPAGCEFVESLRSRIEFPGPTRLGISPHASYSCGDRLFEAAASLGLPLATHLSETVEELEFSRSGGGPLADLLRVVGAWSESLRGWSTSPIERLASRLLRSGAAIAHGNYLDDADLDTLAATSRDASRPLGLVYCPRASAYFGHPVAGRSPHRYRELLARGVPVALGTDSLICLDTSDRLSVLDEMRVLHRRDRVEPRLLLAMATVHGAALLGEDRDRVVLARGASPEGVLSIEVAAVNTPPPGDGDAWLMAAIDTESRPEWIVPPRWITGERAR
ncbi:MAG: amidohydrolase family protein [Phycisphaerales bacterium]